MNTGFVQPSVDWNKIKENIHDTLRRHFDQATGKKPMILPVILEV